VEFHYLLLSGCLSGSAVDTPAADAELRPMQLFKLHGDLPQKVRLFVMF